MAQPYVGEIRMVGFNFAPAGWELCNGQLLPISENETLFNLIGTTYGGDGQSTFAMPDLRGRVPIHPGNGFVQAQIAGEETVTLTVQQIPAHSHTAVAVSGAGNQQTPGGNNWASASTGAKLYSDQAPAVALNPAVVGSSGGNQPHDNLMPFQVVNFIISLYGIFPSQS
jgi:microcystin-dependent protein